MFVSKVAEALYQRGIISYPRTETDFFKEGTSINMSTNVYAIVDMKNNYNRDWCSESAHWTQTTFQVGKFCIKSDW